MNKTTKILAILFTVSLLLVGCGQKEKTKSTNAQTTSQSTKQVSTTAKSTSKKTSNDTGEKVAVFEAKRTGIIGTITLYYTGDVVTKEIDETSYDINTSGYPEAYIRTQMQANDDMFKGVNGVSTEMTEKDSVITQKILIEYVTVDKDVIRKVNPSLAPLSTDENSYTKAKETLINNGLTQVK